MKAIKNNDKVTVQEVITPVPAASVDLLTSHVPSSSNDRGPSTPTGVGALAPVVAVNVTSTHPAIGKNKEEEKDETRGRVTLTQPLDTGGESDSDSDSNNNVNTTILANSKYDEVSKMVEEVSEGVAKLMTNRKKLSGAQRRKLKKAHLRNVKAAVQDAPKEQSETPSTSAEAGKRIRSPEEQNSAKPPKKKKSSPLSSKLERPSQPPHKGVSCQNPSRVDDKVDPNTKKAGATAESSGKIRVSKMMPKSTRKRKMDAERKGNEPPSYAKIARQHYRDELCYAVINSNSASGKIPKDQHTNVEDLVNNKILEHVLNAEDGPPIEIMSCEFKGDILMMKLASPACLETLKDLINGIPPPWEGATLKLLRRKDIPQLIKATVYVKGWGSKFTTERMLGVFGQQNKGLHVANWEVFHREEDSEGTLLVVGLDQLSMSSLVKTKGMAFYVSRAVFFKIGKARVGAEDPKNEPTEKKGSEEEKRPSQPTKDEGVEITISDSQEARLLDEP